MASLQPLVEEALQLVTPNNWLKAVEHAEHIQDTDAEQDVTIDHLMESFVINLEETSDEEMSD